MDESNRLIPMVEGYDQETFNYIYKNTIGLTHKLAGQIDAARFGVDYEEIVSWFNVKLIFVFNRYYQEYKDNPERLKAYVISALQTYKYRVMRSAYQKKYENKNLALDDINLEAHEYIATDDSEREGQLKILNSYMRDVLTPDAWLVFQVDHRPPLYIIRQLQKRGIHRLDRIPLDLIVRYLSFGKSTNLEAQNYVKELRKEYKDAIKSCQGFS